MILLLSTGLPGGFSGTVRFAEVVGSFGMGCLAM
jgi:hypothetical protein